MIVRQRFLLALAMLLIADSASAATLTSPTAILRTRFSEPAHVIGSGTFHYDGAPIAGVRSELEPASAIDDPIGCCGGTGSVNRYALAEPVRFGVYASTTTAIPEPSTLSLSLLGLIGLAASRHFGSIDEARWFGR